MKPKTRPAVKRFLYVFWGTILLLIGLGIYYDVTAASTGGTLYSRYGGSAYVAYGSNEMFIMAAALLLCALLFLIITKLRG